ncbi:hypothetical protein NHB13_10545 [Delftia tsuruhatensis]|uniref:hypothetical protein n=1 Tax=Delftia tsuruhatensis TaxID=180282 RepID=UPI002090CB25|nr:hypothetical protein [Delftia tsuruhatensis]MCO5337037.1 hypothetical protein [Delftia tsuruhatensis]
MPRQQQTNVEFLTELMEFSKFGPMVQGFVIQALHEKADEIANDPHPERYDCGLFDGTYWQEIARDVARQMAEKYGDYNRNQPAID